MSRAGRTPLAVPPSVLKLQRLKQVHLASTTVPAAPAPSCPLCFVTHRDAEPSPFAVFRGTWCDACLAMYARKLLAGQWSLVDQPAFEIVRYELAQHAPIPWSAFTLADLNRMLALVSKKKSAAPAPTPAFAKLAKARIADKFQLYQTFATVQPDRLEHYVEAYHARRQRLEDLPFPCAAHVDVDALKRRFCDAPRIAPSPPLDLQTSVKTQRLQKTRERLLGADDAPAPPLIRSG